MLVCPVCGFRNPHSNERCIKCSALLQRNEEIINQAMYDGAEKARKQFWRDAIGSRVERFQRFLSFPTWQPNQDLAYRFPFTAGGLSLLPGAGQIYNHQVSKGIVLGLIWAVLLAVCIFTVLAPWSNLLLIGLVIAWMLIWNDAVGTAIRINGQRWPLRNSLALLFGAMFVIGASLTALQFFGLSIVSLVRVRQDVHRPLIQQGDHVWVNHTRYWFNLPKAGHLIFFDPPRFTAQAGSNEYSINVKSYFQRVIGLEGDHVEKKNGSFFRNGYPIAREQWPIGGELLPDFSVDVTMGYVAAPVTLIPQDTLANMIGGAISGGISIVGHVGQSNFVFPKWQEAMLVPKAQIFGKAVAVVNPPQHRKGL
ncbi:MAG: S26 family signal peptidase [Candidatus Sumerlaeaceae bacterium]